MKGNFFYRRMGKNISSVRKKKNISQEGLAFLSHIDRTYLARIEEGKANPTIKVLHKIAIQLQVKMQELVNEG
ncbi:helix-turn-helix transcriptional regulator [Candidatus Roizmanbacteria bacterium]|nr:helix-turn-helix transcriptional regulator [Candidatus Roizmanbacteria bacterium]